MTFRTLIYINYNESSRYSTTITKTEPCSYFFSPSKRAIYMTDMNKKLKIKIEINLKILKDITYTMIFTQSYSAKPTTRKSFLFIKIYQSYE